MPASPIPDHVRQLILRAINSVAELEALLLLRDTAPQAWLPENAGARLYVSPTVARYTLTVLAERGFLQETDTGFVYRPQSPTVAEDVTALAQAYARSLIAVTQLIHTKPGPSVQGFAQAFRWRKEP